MVCRAIAGRKMARLGSEVWIGEVVVAFPRPLVDIDVTADIFGGGDWVACPDDDDVSLEADE